MVLVEPLNFLLSFRINSKNPEISPSNSNVNYISPINSTTFWGFKQQTELDSLNSFKIKMNITKARIIYIYNSGKKIKLFVEPGKYYSFVYDTESTNISFNDDSCNISGQIYLNQLHRPSTYDEAFKYINDTSVNLLKEKIDLRTMNDLAHIESLYNSKKISKSFYSNAITDTKYYYALIINKVISNHFFRTTQSEKHPNYKKNFSKSLDSLWKANYIKKPVQDVDAIKSYYWYEYTNHFLSEYHELYKKSLKDTILLNEHSKLREQSEYIKAHLIYAKKFLSGKYLEFYTACFLYHRALQEKYEYELIDIYNDFKTTYPKSDYLCYLDKIINPVIKYHERKSSDFSSQVVFVENRDEINTLENLISKFKGQALFIDIWATWCGSCKEEFIYNDDLDTYLKEKDITKLYISIDKDHYHERWENMIKFYELSGNHIRGNKSLVSDLIKEFDNGGSIYIPWYILVDKKGNIQVKHASKPSQKEKLYKELEEII